MRIIRFHIFLACLALMAAPLLLSACGSGSDEPKHDAPGLYHLPGGTELLLTTDGEQIVLTDTVTHTLRFDSVQVVDASSAIALRTDDDFTATGYDRSKILTDYKKYRLIGLEKYNVDPRVAFVGRFVDYYKDIAVPSGYSLYPSRYGVGYITPHCMGFKEGTTQPGYDYLTTRDPIVLSARTQLLFLRANASGTSLNRNVPCEPASLVWHYRLIPD